MALKFEIIVDDKGNPAIQALGKSTEKTSTAFNKMSSSIGNTISKLSNFGSILGGAAVGGAMLKFIDAADEERRALSVLSNSLSGIGVSFASVKDEVIKTTSALQRKTNYGDEAQIRAIAELTTMTGSYSLAMEYLPTLLDYAAFSQKDLSTATDDVGKALQGNTMALGKQFKDIKNLGDAGATSGEIMDALAKKMKGVAEADVSPVVQFKNALGDAAEVVGNQLLGPLKNVVDAFIDIPDVVKPIIVLAPAIGLAFATMGGPVTVVVTAIGALVIGLAKLKKHFSESKDEFEGFQKSLNKAADEAKFGKDGGGFGDVLKNPYFTENVGDLSALPPEIQDKIKAMKLKKKKVKNGKEEKSDPFGFSDKLLGWQAAGGSAAIFETKSDFDEKSKNELEKQSEILSLQQNLRIEYMEEGAEKEKAFMEAQINQQYEMLLNAGLHEVEIHNMITERKKHIDLAYTGARMQAIGNMLSSFVGLNQLLKGNAEDSKMLARGSVIVDTAAGIMKAYAQGGVLGFITGAAIATQGVAQLATIDRTKFASGGIVRGNGGSRTDNINAMLSPGEHVLSVDDVARLGGNSAIDRAIDSGMRRQSGPTFNFNGSLISSKSFLRDELIPALKAEFARA